MEIEQEKNQTVCILDGFFKSILKGERVALNFLQLLSGTATSTAYLKSLIRRILQQSYLIHEKQSPV